MCVTQDIVRATYFRWTNSLRCVIDNLSELTPFRNTILLVCAANRYVLGAALRPGVSLIPCARIDFKDVSIRSPFYKRRNCVWYHSGITLLHVLRNSTRIHLRHQRRQQTKWNISAFPPCPGDKSALRPSVASFYTRDGESIISLWCRTVSWHVSGVSFRVSLNVRSSIRTGSLCIVKIMCQIKM